MADVLEYIVAGQSCEGSAQSLRRGNVLRLWRPSCGSWGDAVVLAICRPEDEGEASLLAKCFISAGTVLVQYVDRTSWKMLTPEDIARWSQMVVSHHAVIDDCSSLTFTEQLRSLIGLRKRTSTGLGSYSVADEQEIFSVRANMRERANGHGVGDIDFKSDTAAIGAKKKKLSSTTEKHLMPLLQLSDASARRSQTCTTSRMADESLGAAMVHCNHEHMNKDLSRQGSAHKCTLLVRTDPGHRDIGWVSTTGNSTLEKTMGSHAQAVDMANLSHAATMQGDVKAHTVADLAKMSWSEGNAQWSGTAVTLLLSTLPCDAQVPVMGANMTAQTDLQNITPGLYASVISGSSARQSVSQGAADAGVIDKATEMGDASVPTFSSSLFNVRLALPDEPLQTAIQTFVSTVLSAQSHPYSRQLPPDLQSWGQSDEYSFPWLPSMRAAQFKYWRHHNFRGLQLPVMNAVMSGHDVFALMPTGAGKSLCYQLPSLILQGVTIIISPLLSLMHDQVESLQAKGIKASHLASDVSKTNQQRLIRDLADGKVKMLYISPERFVGSNAQKDALWNALSNLHARKFLSLFVVDEAHCISQWGLDFRRKYRELSCLRRNFPGVPLLALTASATASVEKDILRSLLLKNVLCFRDSFERNNLFLEVRHTSSQNQALREIVSLMKCVVAPLSISGILYVASREDVERISQWLRHQAVPFCVYHAGLTLKKRRESFSEWKSGNVQIIVATVALGMGIDKKDVRFIWHLGTPSAIERYHQEIGRAGRDGLPCRCILWHFHGDIARCRAMARGQHQVMGFALQCGVLSCIIVSCTFFPV